MPKSIQRDHLRELLAQSDTQLVEVLPQHEYEWAHIPGARNFPLRHLGAPQARALDARSPVVVYCHNTECDLSPRAAWRLEQLGMTDVFDYIAGKMDWIGAGLPWDGSAKLVSGHYDMNIATCRPDERVDKVAARVGNVELCVVVLGAGIVNGTVRRAHLEDADNARIADVMELGPATVRPSEELDALDARLTRAERNEILVTTPEGRLLGVYRRNGG